MSYQLTLQCGCIVKVSFDPGTRLTQRRVVEHRGNSCPHRQHESGARVWLWEILPDNGPNRRFNAVAGGVAGKPARSA